LSREVSRPTQSDKDRGLGKKKKEDSVKTFGRNKQREVMTGGARHIPSMRLKRSSRRKGKAQARKPVGKKKRRWSQMLSGDTAKKTDDI